MGKGEGNDNPLLYSCLENYMDRGAWWVAVYGVAQSRTRVKRLSGSSNKMIVNFPETDKRAQSMLLIYHKYIISLVFLYSGIIYTLKTWNI